jgi:PleD family two-component response regulator
LRELATPGEHAEGENMAASGKQMLEKYNLQSFKVLVADDDRNMRSILRSTLEAYGFHDIVTVSNGVQACKEFLVYRADLVITDWRMSPLNGLDVVRSIRTAPDSPDPYVPIIMLTGYSDMERVIEARDAGVTSFLAKPITAGLLFARIIEIIESRRPFVAIEEFFGPDRRRRDAGFKGDDRRQVEPQYLDCGPDQMPPAAMAGEVERMRTGDGAAELLAAV